MGVGCTNNLSPVVTKHIHCEQHKKSKRTPMEGSLGFPFPSCHVPRFTRGMCTPGAISTVGVAPMANITTPITEAIFARSTYSYVQNVANTCEKLQLARGPYFIVIFSR